MDNFLNLITTQGEAIFGSLWPLVWALVRIVIIVLPMFGCVAYLTLWERKLIGWMHIRLGPNRVGPLGLLQPIADALKLLMKEIIAPAQASKVLYFIAPIMVIMPAFAAWAVIPFQAKMVLADVNAGLLYIMAIRRLKLRLHKLKLPHSIDVASSSKPIYQLRLISSSYLLV